MYFPNNHRYGDMLLSGRSEAVQAAGLPSTPGSVITPGSCPNSPLVFTSKLPDSAHINPNLGMQNRQTLPPIQSLYQVYSKSMEDSMRVAAQEKMSLQSPVKVHPSVPMPVPLWLHHYNMANVQQVMNEEKALLASHMAASNPYFNFGMLGQYAATKKLYRCSQCRYFTDRKNNLKRHTATMHQECDKLLECCGVVFKNKAALKDHVLIFHSAGYMCRYCGRNFCRKALLKRHLTVHSGQKDYLCPECDYATSHKSNLERHKKVHERQPEQDDIHNSEGGSPRNSEASLASSPERIAGRGARSDGGSSGTEEEEVEETSDLIDVLELDDISEDKGSQQADSLNFNHHINYANVAMLANPLQRSEPQQPATHPANHENHDVSSTITNKPYEE